MTKSQRNTFLRQPCICLVLIIPSRTLTHPVITTYDYTQTIPSRSPSLVLPSISSLCTLCIPQSEYHLRYSSLWSDPVHALSLTHPQLAVKGVVPMNVRVCDFDPRKTCLAELGGVGKRASVGEWVS